MEARDVRDKKEIFPGIMLIRSTLGGYAIEADGNYIGWMHASNGDYWNGYLRAPGGEGHFVGRFRPQLEAARRIVEAARNQPTENRYATDRTNVA